MRFDTARSAGAVYHSEFARCPNDGGPLALSSIDPLLGTTVAHYEIDAYLGGGAMGRVYRCHHTHLQHKQFALKVLRGDLAMRLRFTQEAEPARPSERRVGYGFRSHRRRLVLIATRVDTIAKP